MAKVFISSTSKDLQHYRAVAIQECNRMGLIPVAMEFFSAMGKGASQGSLHKLNEANLYVGIFAHRYGYIEEGYDKSVTEVEFDYAGERSLQRLCFLVLPEYNMPTTEEELNKKQLQDFKDKIEKEVIRAHFTTVEDFQGKLRLALIEWKEKSPGTVLQPALSLKLLFQNHENRLRYGARQTPFIGREEEMATLKAFIDDNSPFLWTIVSGSAGSGKSRLVQELCLQITHSWRAGFLVIIDDFKEWTSWIPETNTLIAIDYAGEQIDVVRNILLALSSGKENKKPENSVRVILIERDANGSWREDLIGARSQGYEINQFYYKQSPITVGPMTPEELWQGVTSIATGVNKFSKDSILENLVQIDPLKRPLFAILAADAIADGQDIKKWDRDRLLRDVLSRERDIWKQRGVTKSYENLLVLATITGGLTEEVLNEQLNLELPSYQDFDRSLYSLMTGSELEGDVLSPLKPDILAEFFVLEFCRGRNDKLTKSRVNELLSIAWKIKGETRVQLQVGELIKFCVPSTFILFIRNLIEDFIDHPSTIHFFNSPSIKASRYWGDVLITGISKYALGRQPEQASKVFEELKILSESGMLLDGKSVIIKAAFRLIPALSKEKSQAIIANLISQFGEQSLNLSAAQRLAFTNGITQILRGLIIAGDTEMAEKLIEMQLMLIKEKTDEQDLRLPYARSLTTLITSDVAIEKKEELFQALGNFCFQFIDDAALYPELAITAYSLFNKYISDLNGLKKAREMNNVIRNMVRKRNKLVLIRNVESQQSPFNIELAHDDQDTLHRCLLQSNIKLIYCLMLAQEEKRAYELVGEAHYIWHSYHKKDIQFAGYFTSAVFNHAKAAAVKGDFEQIRKAFEVIKQTSSQFADKEIFANDYSLLLLIGVQEAVQSENLPVASDFLSTLNEIAFTEKVRNALISFVKATFILYQVHLDKSLNEGAIEIMRNALWAIRSPLYRDFVIEKDGHERIEELQNWLTSINL